MRGSDAGSGTCTANTPMQPVAPQQGFGTPAPMAAAGIAMVPANT